MLLSRLTTLAIPLAALALAAATPAVAGAAVSFELSGSQSSGRCRSSQPLADATISCMTKDLRVVAPGGQIRYAYTVVSVTGCTTMDMIVRTTGRASKLYSFTALSAGAGSTKRGNLTGNLSTIDPPRFAPARGAVVKLSIELPFGACADLRSFRATVRFPTLKKAR